MSCSFESLLLRWDVEINPDNSENKPSKTWLSCKGQFHSHSWCLFPGAILPKMRSVLVEWLVEVHQQFSLLQETLYLSVAILDRFMQVSFNLDSHNWNHAVIPCFYPQVTVLKWYHRFFVGSVGLFLGCSRKDSTEASSVGWSFCHVHRSQIRRNVSLSPVLSFYLMQPLHDLETFALNGLCMQMLLTH